MDAHSPALERMYKVLSDGEWHDFEKVVLEGSKAVEASYALRRADHDQQRQSGGSPRQVPRSEIARVTSGQYAVARETLSAALKRDRLESRKDTDGRLQVRDTYVGLLSLAQVAAQLDRYPGALHSWADNLAIVETIAASLPPGVKPFTETPTGRKVPLVAIDAWRAFSDTRPRPVRRDAAFVEAIAVAAKISTPEAAKLLDAIRADLRRRGLYAAIVTMESKGLGRRKKKTGPPLDAQRERRPGGRDDPKKGVVE
jgi:hypothetical protein